MVAQIDRDARVRGERLLQQHGRQCFGPDPTQERCLPGGHGRRCVTSLIDRRQHDQIGRGAGPERDVGALAGVAGGDAGGGERAIVEPRRENRRRPGAGDSGPGQAVVRAGPGRDDRIDTVGSQSVARIGFRGCGERGQIRVRHDHGFTECHHFRVMRECLNGIAPLGELCVGRGWVAGEESARAERQVLLPGQTQPQRRRHIGRAVGKLTQRLIGRVRGHRLRGQLRTAGTQGGDHDRDEQPQPHPTRRTLTHDPVASHRKR